MKFKHGTRRRAAEYEKDWVQRWKYSATLLDDERQACGAPLGLGLSWPAGRELRRKADEY